MALLGNSRERQAPATERAGQAEQREQEAFQAAAAQNLRRYAPTLLRRREQTQSERTQNPGISQPDAPDVQRGQAAGPEQEGSGTLGASNGWVSRQWDGALADAHFTTPTLRTYDWDAVYDVVAYVRLLDSYSSYRILDQAIRERLYAALTTLIEERFGGAVTLHWQARLAVAHRRQAACCPCSHTRSGSR